MYQDELKHPCTVKCWCSVCLLIILFKTESSSNTLIRLEMYSALLAHCFWNEIELSRKFLHVLLKIPFMTEYWYTAWSVMILNILLLLRAMSTVKMLKGRWTVKARTYISLSIVQLLWFKINVSLKCSMQLTKWYEN